MSYSELTPRIGISSCLVGRRVRYDGDHKLASDLISAWSPYVEWVEVCPEAEIGMGVPREPVQLKAGEGGSRMVGISTGKDWTDEMNAFAQRRVKQLAKEGLWAYVLKANSPSCGPVTTLHTARGKKTTTGLFAAALKDEFPYMPMQDEEKLTEPAMREDFIRRMFGYQRLQWFFGKDRSVGQLVMFHSQSKLELMSHNPKSFGELSALVDRGNEMSWGDLVEQYQIGFTKAMSVPSTVKKHTRVLQHAAAQLSSFLSEATRSDIDRAIGDHLNSRAPLLQPLSILMHHVRTHEVPSLHGQSYLDPHPSMLLMLNRV